MATTVTRAWCSTCRGMRQVMDSYETDTGEGEHTVRRYLAEPLSCGHNASDGTDRPAVPFGYRPDTTLVARLVALQDSAREAGVISR